MVLQAAISLRAAPKVVREIFSHFPAMQAHKIPCFKTVGRWLAQVGLFKLNRLKEKANDWAAIVDFSIQVGAQKCLVVVGLRLSKLKKGRALTFEDLEPLVIEIHEQSNAEAVKNALQKAEKKVGKLKMLCGDEGPDMAGGIKLYCQGSGSIYVPDIAHKAANYLKALLVDDSEWQVFVSAAAEARKKMQQTAAAYLMPPNQRSKSRFLNADILVGWGMNALRIMEGPPSSDKDLLGKYCEWVPKLASLIRRAGQFVRAAQIAKQVVREQGIHRNTASQVEKALEHLNQDLDGMQYAGKLLDFLMEQGEKVPYGEAWIGSSEVIESLFGKLKNLEKDRSREGFTTLVLSLASCLGKTNAEVVTDALMQVKNKDVIIWAKQALGSTFITRRREAFKQRIDKKKNMDQDIAGILEGEAVGF